MRALALVLAPLILASPVSAAVLKTTATQKAAVDRYLDKKIERYNWGPHIHFTGKVSAKFRSYTASSVRLAGQVHVGQRVKGELNTITGRNVLIGNVLVPKAHP